MQTIAPVRIPRFQWTNPDDYIVWTNESHEFTEKYDINKTNHNKTMCHFYGIHTRNLGPYSVWRHRRIGIEIPIIYLRPASDRLKFVMGILILIRLIS